MRSSAPASQRLAAQGRSRCAAAVPLPSCRLPRLVRAARARTQPRQLHANQAVAGSSDIAPQQQQQPSPPQQLGEAVSTVDALLSAADEGGEAEELALVGAGPSDSQDEANPYTPADAALVGAPRPSRYGAPPLLPAAPELERLLADAAARSGEVSMAQLQALFPFPLDAFQERSVEQLLLGKSVVVCAPTGAGKTAIAEAAAAATLARGQRVIYTTPLKALSNQKLAEKAARFGSSRVGLQTGDTSLNTEADIVVMTTEILRNIMYRTAEVVGSGKSTANTRDERLGDVGLVVLDEVHYLGDPWRGSVWEEVIINCPRHIQLLAMSATVRNPDDLGGWISEVHGDCATIKTRFRPVPLRWLFAHKAPRQGTVLEDLLASPGGSGSGQPGRGAAKVGPVNPRLRMEEWLAEERRLLAQKEGKAAAAAVERATLRGGSGSASPSGDASDPLALRYSDRLAAGSGALLPEDLAPAGRGGRARGGRGGGRGGQERAGEVGRRVMGKHIPPQELVVRLLAKEGMLPAIWFIMSRANCDLAAIATNASLVSPEEEALLEAELQQLYADNRDAVREKLVPALLRGVSSHHAGCLPAWKQLVERCFQRGLLKLVYATGTLAAGINMPARTTVISNIARRSDDGIQLLPHNELLQMAGRAGRRGYDTQGNCVLVQGRFEGAEAAHGIIAAGPEPLQSQFTTSYSLVLNLLSAYSLDEARDFLSKSFGTFLTQQGARRRRAEAQVLEATARELTRLAAQRQSSSGALKEAAALVKELKGELAQLRKRAAAERCNAVRAMFGCPSDSAEDAAADAAAAMQWLAGPGPDAASPGDVVAAAVATAEAIVTGDGGGEAEAEVAAEAEPGAETAAASSSSSSSSAASSSASSSAGSSSASSTASSGGAEPARLWRPSGGSARLPALLLLNLTRHPGDESHAPQLLPALAVAVAGAPPLCPASERDRPAPPVLLCLGADNRPLAVGAQHVAGVLADEARLESLLAGQAKSLAQLASVLADTTTRPQNWANLTAKMFSCQVTFGSTLTSSLAVRLNLPGEAFTAIQSSPATHAAIEAQSARLAAAKAALQAARREAEADSCAKAAAAARAAGSSGDGDAGGSSSSSSSSNGAGSAAGSGGGSSSSSGVEADMVSAGSGSGPLPPPPAGAAGAAALAAAGGSGGHAASLAAQLAAGRDPLAVAKRLMKQASKLLREAEEGQDMNTWNSFMDVLWILVELGAMEDVSLRLLPLGLVARSINCNNELWMAAALSHPAVMDLTPPQLAAYVGALQCTDLIKRPMSIWSSYQVSDAVVRVIEQLEPMREAIFEAQTSAGQLRWNEHLAVDLRLAGLVEAWAGGASWGEVMQDTSLDDGDMARLLARTADMLKQMVYLEDTLPYLVDTAKAALRGMDRKPIADLIS